jgi:tetratricopeptide (TPR) repeat protein
VSGEGDGVPALSAEELLDRLALGDALRATLDWSYGLLDERARTLFTRLSVFSGGWTLKAVEEICRCRLDDLATLVGNSLVRRSGGRFVLLETVRQYAQELLAEEEAADIAPRHLDWFVALAETADRELVGADQRRWLDLLADDQDNVRRAITYALATGDAIRAQRLTGALWRFWEMCGHLAEGRAWLAKALDLPGDSPPLVRGLAFTAAGNLARDQGDVAAARELHTRGLELFESAGYPTGVATALNNLGNISLDEGDHEAAAAYCEQSLERFRLLGDGPHIALLLNNLALALRKTPATLSHAASMARESVAEFRKLKDKRGEAARWRVWHTRGRRWATPSCPPGSWDTRPPSGPLPATSATPTTSSNGRARCETCAAAWAPWPSTPSGPPARPRPPTKPFAAAAGELSQKFVWCSGIGRPGPKVEPLDLTASERTELQRWIRRRKGGQDMTLRARLILACDAIDADGLPVSTKVVAEQVGVSRETVSKWRRRFLADRLAGLADEPRPGRPRTVSDEQVAEPGRSATAVNRPVSGSTARWALKPSWRCARVLSTCRDSESTVVTIRSGAVRWAMRQRPSRPSESSAGSTSWPATRAKMPTAFAALSPNGCSGRPASNRMASVTRASTSTARAWASFQAMRGLPGSA